MVSRTPGTEEAPARKRAATTGSSAAANSAARGWPKRFPDRRLSPPPRPRPHHRPPSPPRPPAEWHRRRGDAEKAGYVPLGAWRGGVGGGSAGKAEEADEGFPGGRGRGGGAARSGAGARATADAAGGDAAAADASARDKEAVAAARERAGSVGGGVGSKRPFSSVAPRVYSPHERKRLSATRSFPPGSGRGAHNAPLAGADDGSRLVPAPPRPEGGSAAFRKPATHHLSITKEAGSRGVFKKVSAPAADSFKIRDAGSVGVPKKVSAHADSGGVVKNESAPAAGALKISDAGSGGVPKKVSAHADSGGVVKKESAPAAGALKIIDTGCGGVPKKVSAHADSGGVAKKALSPHDARPSIREAGSGGVAKKVSDHAGSGGGFKKVLPAHAARPLPNREADSRGALKASARPLSIGEAGSRGAPKKVSDAVVSHPIEAGGRHGSDAAAGSSSGPSRRSAVAAADGFLDTGSKGVAESSRFGRGKKSVPALPLQKPSNMPKTRRLLLERRKMHRRVRVLQSHKSADKRPSTESKESATARGFFILKKKVIVHPAYTRSKVASASTMGTISNPDDVVAAILKDDIFLKELAAYERKLESELNVSSDVPSPRCQRQCGTQNADARSKFEMMCKRFEFVLLAILKTLKRRSLKIGRIDLAAYGVIKKLPGFAQPGPIVGNVHGVEVGDQFLYRVEMDLVGLHRQFRQGIATTRDGNGELIAISIVASGGYPDTVSSSGELIYTGSGGKLSGKKSDENQKLKRGNLALKNCFRTQTPVRVIFGLKISREERAKGASAFIYGGLYRVVEWWKEGEQGSKKFKYRLQRIPGQPELPHSKIGIMRLGQ